MVSAQIVPPVEKLIETPVGASIDRWSPILTETVPPESVDRAESRSSEAISSALPIETAIAETRDPIETPLPIGDSIYVWLPRTRLWQTPIANQREPAMWSKLTDFGPMTTIDTAIGGSFGLVGWRSERFPRMRIQIDGFAAAFTRFNERRLLTAADYRVGAPITFGFEGWSFKIGYEHTSTHLGDEFMAASGRIQVSHVRDEIVFGVAREIAPKLKVYGQFGYSFAVSRLLTHDRDRFNLGFEWGDQNGGFWYGSNFAAVDFDFRSEQDYRVNLTAQFGRRWIDPTTLRSARIGIEYYDGRSPYGQFFRESESWVGLFAGLTL